MASSPDSAAEIERQRAEIEAAFRERRALPDAGGSRGFVVPAWAEEHKGISEGGRTSPGQVTAQAGRGGPRPGDPLPPGQPGRYTGHVTATEVIVTGEAPRQRVAVLFSHEDFPGVRFGHRFYPDHPDSPRGEYFRFMRDIEEGELHRMMETGPSPASSGIIWTVWGAPLPGIEPLRAEIETGFREGWQPIGAGKPRVLTERAYAEARRILTQGGWTGLDRATIEAVRGGAHPGDPLPALQPDPYIDKVTDAEVIITGSGPHRRVAVLFSHEDFPGARFGHRFPTDPDIVDPIDLKEEIETGALDRMMQDQPAADDDGIIWTTREDPDQD
jgi:hypothetical protein